jgi:Uma2 family endonuclease
MEIIAQQSDKEFTIEEFLQVDEELCQLINGRVIMTPAPNTNHQKLVRELLFQLSKFADSRSFFFAPLVVFLDDKNVFQPDLLFIAEERAHIISERGIEGAPDLIVEVLSPSNAYFDRYEKKDTYFRCGVKEYWIVDPANQTLEIYTLAQENKNTPHLYLVKAGEVKSTVLPKLKFDLKDVFNPNS